MPPSVTTTGLANVGVLLAPYTDPRFQAAVAPNSDLAAVPEGQPFAVLVINQSTQNLRAFEVLSTTINAAGKKGAGGWNFNQFDFPKQGITPGESFFVSLFGPGHIHPLGQSSRQRSRLQQILRRRLQSVASIRHRVDATLFEDGTIAGPNTRHSFECWRAQLDSRLSLYRALAAAPQGAERELVNAYIEPVARQLESFRRSFEECPPDFPAAEMWLHLSAVTDRSKTYATYLARYQIAVALDLSSKIDDGGGPSAARAFAALWMERYAQFPFPEQWNVQQN